MLGSGPMKRRFWQKFVEVQSLDGLWEIMARHLRCLPIAMDHGGIVETAYPSLSEVMFLILRVEEFSSKIIQCLIITELRNQNRSGFVVSPQSGPPFMFSLPANNQEYRQHPVSSGIKDDYRRGAIVPRA